MEQDEETEAEGDDEEGVPGEEEEEGLEDPQEHRHVDVALAQLGVHPYLHAASTLISIKKNPKRNILQMYRAFISSGKIKKGKRNG